MKSAANCDLLILGGGIAGMTAAIFAARANLATVIVEERVCGGLANWSHRVDNFPSHPAISGMDLMERVLDQVLALGVTVDEAVEVERLELVGAVKCVETAETIYTARAIILATGREPLRLPIATDCDCIHYCSVCDGSAYTEKEVLVVGGGNSAFDEALYLLSLGVRRITLVEALDHCSACEGTQARLLCHENVQVKTCSCVRAIESSGARWRATLENPQTGEIEALEIDGIFVFIGQRPNTGLFDGVTLDQYGYLLTGPDCDTNLPGVYAAGDLVQKSYRYLTTAMADGTIAALAAAAYLSQTAPAVDA